MPFRKERLVTGEYYHIFSRSIAEFEILKTQPECERMLELFQFYNDTNPPCSFSQFPSFMKRIKDTNHGPLKKDPIVRIICYCLMPTHIHLILKQLKERGIEKFIECCLKSYSHYFNLRRKRKGPLWEGAFKNVRVKTDEQLLHLTRYIHLNPVTAYLVDKPEEWNFSSYNEYLQRGSTPARICDFTNIIDIKPEAYRSYVEDRIDYQRKLAKIKALTWD